MGEPETGKRVKDGDRQIGSMIRIRRMMLGMSQEKLGEALGLTFQQIQKYEKGTNRVSGSRLMEIAGALKMSPAAFFPTDDVVRDPSIDNLVTMLSRDRNAVVLFNSYQAMSPRLRYALCVTADVLAQSEAPREH